MRSILLVFLLLGLTAGAARADVPSFLVRATPAEPVAGDSVAFVVTTDLPYSCWGVQAVTCGVSDTTGTISVQLIRRDEPCLPPSRRVDEACGVGPLPAGHYTVFGVLSGFDARENLIDPPDTVAVRFTVSAETPVAPITWGLLKARY